MTRAPPVSETYACRVCGREFGGEYARDRHQREHPTEKIRACLGECGLFACMLCKSWIKCKSWILCRAVDSGYVEHDGYRAGLGRHYVT